MLKGNFLEIWDQGQHMFFVGDEVKVFRVPFSFDLDDDQGWISKYTLGLDSQIYGSFETKNTRFVFRHVICTVESKSCSEWCMTSFRGYDYITYAIAECVRRSIKNQGPSGSLFRSVIWFEFFTVVHHHNVFIWEFEFHGLVVIHNLMSKVID